MRPTAANPICKYYMIMCQYFVPYRPLSEKQSLRSASACFLLCIIFLPLLGRDERTVKFFSPGPVLI